jgi:lipoate-protein ligase B
MEKQSTFKTLWYIDAGSIDYRTAWDIQKEVLKKRIAGEIPDTLLLLEHPNTYTLGKTADKLHLIGNERFLKEHNISIFEIDRGGDITYHGPGQIVGYPIIHLSDWEQDAHKYLRALEEVIIRVCSEYNIEAGRNTEYTGVWVDDAKIAAIGIKISRWVTMHGFAFNINTDLNLFNGIIPCGIQGKPVISLEKILGKKINVDEVKKKIRRHFVDIFRYDEELDRKLHELKRRIGYEDIDEVLSQ